MSIEKRPSDSIPSASPAGRREAAATRSAATMVAPWSADKSGEIGCVLAELAVRIGDRLPDDYAAFLEEL